MNLDLDPSSSVPLYQQIVDEIRRLVARGALRPGDRLPPVRELATRCRVNRNTAARAVQSLEAEGLVTTRVGSGTFVAEDAEGTGEHARAAALERTVRSFLREARALGASPREIREQLDRLLEDKEKQP